MTDEKNSSTASTPYRAFGTEGSRKLKIHDPRAKSVMHPDCFMASWEEHEHKKRRYPPPGPNPEGDDDATAA